MTKTAPRKQRYNRSTKGRAALARYALSSKGKANKARYAASPKGVYAVQKHNAKHRGIEFLLTFEEWHDVWIASGKWTKRGCKRGQYVMSRRGDVGSYTVDNVDIVSCGENVREFNNRRWSAS